MSVSFKRFQFTTGFAALVIAGFAFVYSAFSPAGQWGNGVEATLHIARVQRRILERPETISERDDATFERYRRTQATLIKNSRVVGHAMMKPQIAALRIIQGQSDPEAWVQQNLKVDFPGDGEVIIVSMDGSNRVELATLVNAIVDSYMSQAVAAEKGERVNRLHQLKNLREKYEAGLDTKRKALHELAGEVGAPDESLLRDRRLRDRQIVEMSRPDLLRIRLEKVAAETKLERRKAVKEPTATDREAVTTLEESIAVLTQQAKFLEEQEVRLEQAPIITDKRLDLENEKAEIEVAAEMFRRVAAEVEAVEVELQAPDRIQILAKAKP